MIETWAAGDLSQYRSLFVDKANVNHNAWGNDNSMTIDELLENHKKHHEQLAKPVEVMNSIYEVVTLKNGGKHGHVWANFKFTYKSGEEITTPVFVALGINDESKIWYEWAFYDTSLMPSSSPYNQSK